MNIQKGISRYVKEISHKTTVFIRYRRTILFLLKSKGFKAAFNFIFVKLFVKEGEGGLGLMFYLIRPILRIFPRLGPIFASYPYNLEIEITNRCNKLCIICEHTYWKEPNKDLTYKEFLHIVKQFPKLKWINLTGEGDAFLNKDYLKMIEYSKNRNISVFLVDSFDLINENISEKIVSMKVDGIWISMDGATKKTYEKIKIGCNFEKVINNIKYLIHLKEKMKTPIPELCFRFIINKLNYHEMPMFVDLVHSLGDKKLLGDNSSIEFAGLLTFKEIEHLYIEEPSEKIIKETTKKGKMYKTDISFSHSSKSKLPKLRYCSAWVEPYIMMGGYVLPCCATLQNNNRDLLRDNCLGNIFEESFRSIWNSEKYKKFRSEIPKKNGQVHILCKNCRAYNTKEREECFGIWT